MTPAACARSTPAIVVETFLWPGTWMAGKHWRAGIRELRMAASSKTIAASAARYVPSIELADFAVTTSAGVRAQAISRRGDLVDDFLVSAVANVTYLRNAPSPAATASLAIGRRWSTWSKVRSHSRTDRQSQIGARDGH